MDRCRRQRIHYCAINVRYVNDQREGVTKAMVLRNTQAQHTSEYLSDLVEKVLDEFEMKKEQVLCIITDNASNMLSMVEKLNAVTEEDNDS